MPRLRSLIPILVAGLFLVVPVSPAHAACEKFEVGSSKWQKCLEDTVNDAFDNDDKGKGGGGAKGDQGDESEQGGTGGDDCSSFDVGSSRWQQCIQDKATGGAGGFKGPEGSACSEYSVGSKAWTDCIEGAATGGGLMPWIVVIPLGVMVLGMIFMFTRQAMRARRGEAFSSGRIGTGAGGWLIFMALIEGSIGVGMVVAEMRADGSGGGFSMAAYALLGVAVILLIIGVVVMVKGRKKVRIETTGTPGQATVRNISQTGTYINQNPQFIFELDVNVPGMAQYRTSATATVPMYLVQAVGPGAVLPVKVDPGDPNELVIDWSGVSLTRGATPAWSGQPPAGTPGWPAGTPGTMGGTTPGSPGTNPGPIQ
ncbi:MAG TPA: hypothetical protein VIG64_12040 [Actinomycetota bacterium]|jgi:hypothetical protein